MIFQNFGFNRLRVVSAGGNDPDAQAFINATGISGTTATAINQLVLDLKSYSLWTKMVAIYPLVGGTSSSTSYNLKNTAQYQVTWNGTITFASTGVAGNGTTGWGNTGLNPSATGLFGSGAHLSTYARTSGNAAAYDIGANRYPNIAPSPEWMIARFTNDRYTAFGNVVPGNPYIIATSATYHTQLYTGTHDGTLTPTLYKNGTQLATSSSKGYSIVNNNIALLALNKVDSGGAQIQSDFSSREYAWFSIGLSLTATEVANFSTAVTTFQTSLGRNVT